MLQARTLRITNYIVLFLFFAMSIFIRPIADDYCAGAGTGVNIRNYIWSLSQSWSGDYFQILTNAILVGFPTANLPFYILGISTFFTSVLLVLLASKLLISKTFSFSKSESSLRYLTNLFVLIFWNMYWALQVVPTGITHYHAFLNDQKTFAAVFGWATVITQYVISPILLLVLALFIDKYSWKNNAIFFLLGFLIGVSGYALAISVFIFLILGNFHNMFLVSKKVFFVLVTAIFFGVVLSLSSSGARSRATIFEGTLSKILDSDLIIRWSLVSFAEFITSFANLGVLLVFLGTIVIMQFSSLRGFVVIKRFRLAQHLRYFFLFLCLYYSVISFSEFLIYEAFWHLITFKVLVFAFVSMLGLFVSVSYPVNSKLLRNTFIKRGILTIFLACLVFTVKIDMTIIARGLVWNNGPSPFPGISDISLTNTWIDVCWENLKDIRSTPVRN